MSDSSKHPAQINTESYLSNTNPIWGYPTQPVKNDVHPYRVSTPFFIFNFTIFLNILLPASLLGRATKFY